MVRVLSLFSGSLASRVATRLVERHPDVESVCLLHLRSPFASSLEELRELVRSEWPDASYRTQSLKREYRKLIGVSAGKPFRLTTTCSHCRAILYSRAFHYMERIGAQYLVSGEIPEDDGEAACVDGLEGRLLRPFFTGIPPRRARRLEEWSEESSAIGSMSRTEAGPQLERLAVKLDLTPWDPLAAEHRCKLRRPGFGERVANLFAESGFTLNALRLLDYPLYYKIHADTKIVIAVTEEEKRELQNLLLPQDLRVYPSTPHGPMMLVRTLWHEKTGGQQEELIDLAARIAATHTVRQNGGGPIPVYYRFERDDRASFVNVAPFRSVEEIMLLDAVTIGPCPAVTVEQKAGTAV